tara:strand:- start:71 stop:241 length:171 start_codon:yes stop_codon:yes gene_type:complete
MLQKIIVDVLKKYNDANLRSEAACEIIAEEVCNKWDDCCRVPEKRWSKQDAATKET